jgi:predicted lipoprotein with Yx(FWY)xxD motif
VAKPPQWPVFYQDRYARAAFRENKINNQTMKKLTPVGIGIAMLTLMISFNRCSKNNGYNYSNNGTPPPPLHVQLKTSTTLGSYLADRNGQALYFFSNDANGQSSCTGGCETYFPIVSDSNLTAAEIGTGLNLTDFTSIKTSEGKTQLVYKGWPLYTYSPQGTPETSGMTTGDGVGGLWFVAKPDYTIMLANAQLVGANGIDYTSAYQVGTGQTVYFTDAWGLTLYTFFKDSAGINKFTKSDFSNNAVFPIYDTTSIVVPSTLTKTLFGTTTVFGKSQMTYKGWPLYYYGADSSKRGNNKAVSIGQPTFVAWPVAVQNMPPAPHP